MADTVLQLTDITKTFVLGRQKSAKKAQKAIEKLQRKYEKLSSKKDAQGAKKIKTKISKAQKLFANEKYAQSYFVSTGKRIKSHKKTKGIVVHALNGINLEIKKGDLVAIMGPSGSGKSTLLNMLGLLDKPTSGELTMNGKGAMSIKRRELPEIRSKELGFVFQAYNLVPTLTALENVMLPLRYTGVSLKNRRKTARDTLKLVGLGDRVNHTPNELSGGQRQRVPIARSIVNSPAIVFGDELTGELDSKMSAEIMRLIVKLNKKGQTFIIVTHNPDVASVCKRIIHMRDGKIEKEVKN